MELDIHELAFGRGSFRLRSDLSLGSEEFGVVLGASGCGKSTLLRLVAGLLSPDSGQILLGGRNLTTLPPEKRNMGFVFQDFALFPHLSARKNIEYGPRRHGFAQDERQRICQELAGALHIDELLDRRPQFLSGGEQQRVALARALAVRPDLVLMDEPLSSLDEVLRKDLRSVIRERLGSLGVTTLYVTHDTGEALAIADRLFVMKNGTVSHSGKPEDLLRDPPDAAFVRFMSLGPLLPVLRTSEATGGILCSTPVGDFLCLAGTLPPSVAPGTRLFLHFPGWAASTASGLALRKQNSFRALVLTSIPEGRSRKLGIAILPGSGTGGSEPVPGSAKGEIRAEIEVEAATAPRAGELVSFSVPPEDCRIVPEGSDS